LIQVLGPEQIGANHESIHHRQHLVRELLQNGHEVRALARNRAKANKTFAGLNVEIIEGDMENVAGFAKALEGCDALFHTAAFFREYYEPGDHWPTLKGINVDATIELLEAAERAGVKRAVHTSSSGTIGMKPNGAYGDESTVIPLESTSNLYFRSKVECDAAIATFLKSHRLEVMTILPGWMFGPGDAAPTNSGQLVLDFLGRKLPGILDGGTTTVDARDVARAMRLAAQSGRSGEKYIVAGNFVSFEQIFLGLEKASSVAAPTLRLPNPLILMLAHITEFYARLTNSRPILPVEGIKAMQAKTGADSSKAVREFGLSFRSIEETLRDTVAWYRSNGYGPIQNAKINGEKIGSR
jgi:dihydroflavonol-4-reductase